MVRSPICVWGVGWSDAVTKWHLMRGDDDHEFEIVITRSHSLLCFLTASIQKMDYQSIFQCKLSGFNNRNTDYVWLYDVLCPSNVTIWLHRQCNNRWRLENNRLMRSAECRADRSYVFCIGVLLTDTDTDDSMSVESQVRDHRTTELLLVTSTSLPVYLVAADWLVI